MMANLNMSPFTCRADARKIMDGEGHTVSGYGGYWAWTGY